MAGQPITFPTSTQPSLYGTENGGRLINCFSEKAPPGSRNPVLWRSVPGLRPAFTAGATSDAFRGSININNVLYAVFGATVYSISLSAGVYTVTALTGSVTGTGLVMMERNMRTPEPQVLILDADGGLHLIDLTAGSVADYSDADLPLPNSVSFLDSYFLFTIANGAAFASGQNDVTVNALDTATAEASPDGLVRGITIGSEHLLMGANSIEFWMDAGNSVGYPFSRSTVIPLGLFGVRAVAGMERGFTGDVCFVANDRKVYRLNAYTPVPISTPHIEALLQAITDPGELDASVYSISGHSCWVLTSSTWTVVFDQSTGEWHERASVRASRWRALGGVNCFDTWLVFERGGNQAYVVDPLYRRENADQLVVEIRSTQEHRFPGRFVVNRASFDIMTGVGIDDGISPIETDPVVEISWSDDGGARFCPPTQRSLGRQGSVTRIDRRNCGITKQLGRQWRLQIADPVPVTIMGGAMEVEARMP